MVRALADREVRESCAPVLVTGASGLVGRAVCIELEHLGIAYFRANRIADGSNDRAFDFSDPAGWTAALAGVRSIFLLRPPAIADVDPTVNAFASAAVGAGVGRIVFLSVAGADRLPFLPHARIERHVMAITGQWTLLRPGYFAQNLETALLHDIRERGRITVPAGGGRVAFVDVNDVAAAAAQCLVQPDIHLAKAYHLTGPIAATFTEVAEALSRHSDGMISYLPADPLAYFLQLRRAGIGAGHAAVQTMLHVGLRFGQGEAISHDLAALLGRPPTDIFQYIERQRAVFTPGSGQPN